MFEHPEPEILIIGAVEMVGFACPGFRSSFTFQPEEGPIDCSPVIQPLGIACWLLDFTIIIHTEIGLQGADHDTDAVGLTGNKTIDHFGITAILVTVFESGYRIRITDIVNRTGNSPGSVNIGESQFFHARRREFCGSISNAGYTIGRFVHQGGNKVNSTKIFHQIGHPQGGFGMKFAN